MHVDVKLAVGAQATISECFGWGFSFLNTLFTDTIFFS